MKFLITKILDKKGSFFKWKKFMKHFNFLNTFKFQIIADFKFHRIPTYGFCWLLNEFSIQ